MLNEKDLEQFFQQLKELEDHYIRWTDTLPKKLVINPSIIARLARVPGFYQRPELQSEVTLHAPVVRYFKLEHTVVTIQEDYDIKFLYFE